MYESDDEPRPRSRLPTPALDPLSVADLQAYIGELGAEIARAEAAIARKQGHRSAAEGFFRLP